MGRIFKPSDQQCLTYVLRKTTSLASIQSSIFISIETINIYGEEDQSQIFAALDHRECYFFTKLKKANNNDHEYSRRCAKGIWTECGERETVLDRKGEPFGWLRVQV
ncbi:UNVERIFIED_CONTAM: hypothetical protein Sradi_7090500 [Sesamum radiatum]|uniref:NAC domain-containing protein n=1 Tax=Sesamum radiatum TaxID=300843 RepID=A0AAW2J3Q0_SESRA